jgi:hypothetical protein
MIPSLWRFCKISPQIVADNANLMTKSLSAAKRLMSNAIPASVMAAVKFQSLISHVSCQSKTDTLEKDSQPDNARGSWVRIPAKVRRDICEQDTLKSTARGSRDKQNCLRHSPITSVKKKERWCQIRPGPGERPDILTIRSQRSNMSNLSIFGPILQFASIANINHPPPAFPTPVKKMAPRPSFPPKRPSAPLLKVAAPVRKYPHPKLFYPPLNASKLLHMP